MAPVATIIVIGLPVDHAIVKAHFDPEVIRAGIEKVLADTTAAGYAISAFFLQPDDGMAPLIAELKQKSYDGVMIGFGVRGTPELTVFFEDIVNTVREHAPSAKLLFNSSPPTTLDAAKRGFPLAG